MLPPILEIYVVWHPGDSRGQGILDTLLAHFRGTAFSGLIGGAIDVYSRSAAPTGAPHGAPRPIPAVLSPPYGLRVSRHTAVVVVGGSELAAAVEAGGLWREYLEAMVAKRDGAPDEVSVFPVKIANLAFDKTVLGSVLGAPQQIAADAWGTDAFDETMCRDLAQGIAQAIDPTHQRLKVFISHTKRHSDDEQGAVERLVDLVRKVINGTRLSDFFDAADLQPGEDWAPTLIKEAASSALLAVRTDLYSSRPWCQREVLTAKQNGMPVIMLEGLTHGEERGSFLMDHVPRVAGHRTRKQWSESAIRAALNRLVDECLKRALWRTQYEVARGELNVDIDWWAPHAPEPATFATWLETEIDRAVKRDEPIIVLHPDPPLGDDEKGVLEQIARLAGLFGPLQFLTPRGLAVRGG